jgi:hypothetical protein
MGLFKDCGCGCNGRKQEEKLIISIISGLTFFIVANPETFRIVRAILGSWISTPTGCPSTLGLLVHTLVFILIVWGMMNIKKHGGCPSKKKGCGCGGAKKGTKVVSSNPQFLWRRLPILALNLANLKLRWWTVVVFSSPCPSIPMAPYSSKTNDLSVV